MQPSLHKRWSKWVIGLLATLKGMSHKFLLVNCEITKTENKIYVLMFSLQNLYKVELVVGRIFARLYVYLQYHSSNFDKLEYC
jgi:hypothetical protein